MPWISRPCTARIASSLGSRSSVERYSEPSKLNLIAFTRLALTANVAQPMITPMNTPAMKPIWRMSKAMARREMYSIGDSRRAD
jgi:hypothetical protein